MRYLYGDSVPFPHQYNFLATLEAFVASAARAVQLEAECRALAVEAGEVGASRLRGVDALETFHQAVMRTISDTATKMTHPQALEYARVVADHALQFVEDNKRAALATNEREALVVRAEVDRRRTEARGALEGFLKVARFPVISAKVALRLHEGKNELTAIYTHPDGLMTAFSLAPTGDWGHPRKLGEFVQGLDMNVGVKKSWFKGTVSPDSVHMDDQFLGYFDVSDESCEFRLRKKATERDSLVFRVRRFEGDLVAEVGHPGDPNAGSLPPGIEASDRPQLEKIWNALRHSAVHAQEHRERLLRVTLDGEDVFEADKMVPFVQRVVAVLAPTVGEISKRSPNRYELSLKLEGDGGKREELYLRKEDLLARLEPLSDKERRLFNPLGISS